MNNTPCSLFFGMDGLMKKKKKACDEEDVCFLFRIPKVKRPWDMCVF